MAASHNAIEDVSGAHYRRLAEFRYRIRQFLHFSEEVARIHGVEPQQHQLMLAIKGLPPGTRPTVRAISSRLCLRHNSTVELINRLAARGALVRRPSDEDRREVLVELTEYGEELLKRLSVVHWEELQTSGPALTEALQAVITDRTYQKAASQANGAVSQ
ncbi:MAG: MarR family transcriptional regulator [Acidobacteriaceae bacterium]|nr:MarR family transcriptional regulator [Acidobacteriaceae bacterium]